MEVELEEKDLMNLIREAIKLEINGRQFFSHVAEITHNELGKKMFQKLSKDEVHHLETFSQIFTEMTGSNDWKKQVKLDDADHDSTVINELAARLKKAGGQSELEALRIGMELEQKAVEFFRASGDETSDPKIRDIFDKICEEENFHFDLLQAQLDSLTRDGIYYDVSEFQMDGKY
jgi:rubrerythrin